MILDPCRYLTNASLTATTVFPPIDCRALLAKRVSFTLDWSAVASTDGDFHVEVSDDPRVEQDKLRGTTTAKWIRRTIPAGASDGTNVTVTGKNATINASAGDMSLNLDEVPAWVRLAYTRRGGGSSTQLQAFVSGD